MGYDWAGSSNASAADRDIDWSDPASVRKSEWWLSYKTKIKGQIIICAQMAGVKRIVMIAIEGGPISDLEARELPSLKQQAQADLETKGISTEVNIQDMSYETFVRDYSSTMSVAASSATTHIDWLLVEWLLAIELHQANRVLTVLPILLGEKTGGGMIDLLGTRDAYGHNFVERLPSVVPAEEIALVRDFMLENQLQPSAELATRTVRQTVEVLTQRFLSLRMWELCGDASEYDPHGAASAAGPSQARGEHYMFEQCALEVASAVQETLKRRAEAADDAPPSRSQPEPEPEIDVEPEPEPQVPEGIPPSPAASTSSADEFTELLRQLNLLDYAAALADEEILSAEDLRHLTAEELTGLGFKLGARKRVLRWSAAL